MNPRIFAFGALVATVAFITSPSRAGQQSELPVAIYGSTVMEGAMGSAYHSSDQYQYIGCQSSVDSSGNITVNCYAEDASQNQASCTASGTNAVQFAQNLAQAASDSTLEVVYSGSTCSNVIVITAS